MAETIAGVSGLLRDIFDDNTELTDLSDLEETPPSTSEMPEVVDRPPSPVPWADDTRIPRRTITYKSKRRFPKDMPRLLSSSKTETELKSRSVRKRAVQEDSPKPPSAKRRKLEAKPPSTPSVSNPLSTPTSSLGALNISSSFVGFPTSGEFDEIFGERDVVWVKVDLHGDVVESGSNEEDGSFHWWPAQVLGDDPAEITVELFGNPTYGRPQRAKLRATSSAVVPFRRSGQLRFDESVFFKNPPEKPEDVAIQQNFTKRWKVALNQALQAEKEEELPDASSLIYDITPSKKLKEKEPFLPCALPESQTEHSPQLPEPLPDDNVRIGKEDGEDGELVLASAHRHRPDHWPARVIGRSYDQRTRKWLYEVCYMDNERQKLERSRFYTNMDPGFATCRMGQWKTFRSAAEESSDDEEGTNARHEVNDPPSPSLSDPNLEDIKDQDEFFDRPLSDQLKFVYPILCRSIRRQYPPGIKDHDSFIKGGKARQALVQSAANYGQFSEAEVKKITDLVRKNMLRDERWGERMFEGDEEGRWLEEDGSGLNGGPDHQNVKVKSERNSGKQRPRGCEEYENLSRADRGLYSTDVLLRIAILQLHLFRSGGRVSWKMESEERENALYEEGLKLMAARNDNQWVNEIMAMRQMAENFLKRKKRQKEDPPPTSLKINGDVGGEETPPATTCTPLRRSQRKL